MRIEILNAVNSLPFHGLTFASVQPLLYEAGAGRVIGVGAYHDDQPVGLALAVDVPEKTLWRLASLYVPLAQRRRGIGTALVRALERAVSLGDRPRLRVRYLGGKPGTQALERLLARQGWPAPLPEKLICRCDRRMMEAPWMRDHRVPEDAELVWWKDVRADELAALREEDRTSGWIPRDLRPWDYGDLAFNSVGLRQAGRIRGWVLTQQTDAHTLSYSNCYMHPDRQRLAAFLPLFVKAIRCHYEQAERLPHAIWLVSFEHPGMIRFVRSRMEPYMRSVEEHRVSLKLCDPVAATATELVHA